MVTTPACFFKRYSSPGRRALTRYQLWIAGAAIIGLVARAWHVHLISYSPITDMRTYLQMIWWIFEGKYPENLRWSIGYPPGYPLFLWIVSKLFGLATLKPVGYVQAFIESGAILSLAAVTRRLVNAQAAVLAAYGWAFYHLAIASTSLALTETLTADFLIFSTHAFLYFLKAPSVARLVLPVLVIAGLGHIRTNLLPIAGVYAVFAAWQLSKRAPHARLRAFITGGLLLGGVVMLCVPWAIRNSRVAGKLSFVSNNLGGMLLVGNNPVADGGFPDMRNAPKDVPYPSDDEAKMLAYGKAWLKSHPATEIFYLLPNRVEKLFIDDLRFWPWEENVGGSALEFPFGPWIFFPTLPYAPILYLGLLGFFLPKRSLPRLFLPALWFSTWAPLLILNVQLRYRFVSDWILILCAAQLLVGLKNHFHIRNAGRYALIAIGIFSVAGTIVTNLRLHGPDLLRSGRAANVSPELAQILESGLETKTGKDTKLPVSIPLCTLPINSGRESDLLIRTRFSIHGVEFYNSGQGMDIILDYLDSEGSRITLPNTPYKLTWYTQILANYLEKESEAWRVVRVPAMATNLRLSLKFNSVGSLRVHNLEVRGPVWSR